MILLRNGGGKRFPKAESLSLVARGDSTSREGSSRLVLLCACKGGVISRIAGGKRI